MCTSCACKINSEWYVITYKLSKSVRQLNFTISLDSACLKPLQVNATESDGYQYFAVKTRREALISVTVTRGSSQKDTQIVGKPFFSKTVLLLNI